MAMRRLRGARGLRELAGSEACRTVGLSKSSLSRYERGLRPPLRYAQLISDLYGGDGWLELAIRSLWMSDWDPWASEFPESAHVLTWPASYSGRVWIHIRPNPNAVNESHSLRIDWGPWSISINKVIPEAGILLSTGKGKDVEVPVPCLIEASFPIYVLHGIGFPNDAADISREWKRT
ncbi:helix-turn-helix domain-containing protein [Schaalia canis]|uniref:helix-turn-helix domain-containing protein n=1 Tax=Schaalia canis TaxID=100469 RepID=UPI003B833083